MKGRQKNERKKRTKTHQLLRLRLEKLNGRNEEWKLERNVCRVKPLTVY